MTAYVPWGVLFIQLPVYHVPLNVSQISIVFNFKPINRLIK